MSSSSRRRPDRRWWAAAALTAATVAGALGLAAPAGAAPTLAVVAVQPAGDDVTLVAAVTPVPGAALPAGDFRLSDAGGDTVAATAAPVLSGELATALVLDTSEAGAAALQGGVNGAASFLLQLPDGARTLVVADGGPATLLAPLTPGATTAIAAMNAVRPGGDRETGSAVQVALDGLPAVRGRPRVLLLHTGAADAGGEPAAALAGRLRAAGVLLAVVATGPDQRYWAQVAADTGGVLVSGRGAATLGAFDRVAGVLRGRYAVTFPRPAVLPATMRLSVRVDDQTASAPAVVPVQPVVSAPVPGEREPGGGSGARWWLVLLVVLVVAGAAGSVLLLRRRAGTPVRREPDEPEPAALPHPRPAPAADLEEELTPPLPPLPRRRPGASTAIPPLAPTPAPTPPLPPTPAPTPLPPPPAARTDPAPAAPATEPARPGPTAAAAAPLDLDREPYERLDAQVGDAAEQVVAGRLDTAHAVARIAFAARGRLELLDRVIETERRLAGANLGGGPSSDAVLGLLTAARRIVAGEVALVGPAGVRVEQGTRIGPDGRPRHVLRLTGRDRLVLECRTAGELARHVDLASLTPDSST